ncbi:hypothetical protein N7474_006705 [Penicillium riverlandense]|uniref:uncharacterized protein n=1 Tax=Penicillium riverlandense TaxID=1903569 RepID=UPI002548CB3C|nr:uncharacterized protein N7474_006705 [Penicillium riverlandense]KAJ5814928.1 hypothetical protein N7474_006705 [Penicillium riverlandense]
MASSEIQEGLLKRWFPHTTTPFVANAPMLGFTDSHLAATVTRSGGLGFIGGGFDFGPESAQLARLDTQLAKSRSELGISSSARDLPIGVGFITFNPAGFEVNAIPILEKHRVAAVWLSFPESDADHLPLIEAIHKVQAKGDWVVKIFVQVGTVQAARHAVEQGADVVVVQGTDAGGHQWAQGASLMSLLPEVRDSVAGDSNKQDTAIVAAGGIVDGRGCVAALGLGADGIVMGTRFIATSECPAPSFIKQSILSASDGAVSTIKSTLHDVFQSTDVFPKQYDGRAVISLSWNDSQSGVSNEEVTRRYNDAIKQGENHRRTIWAGASVGVIDTVVSIDQLMKDIQQQVKLAIGKVMERI